MINWQPTQLAGRDVNYRLPSSVLAQQEWTACEKIQNDMAVCRNNIQCKDCKSCVLSATEMTSMVESISVCMLTNRRYSRRYSCPTAMYGQSCYHLEKTSALTEGHCFREWWVTKKYAIALCRKPKNKKGKKIPQIRMCRKRLDLASMHV